MTAASRIPADRTFSGVAVNTAIQRLCARWGTGVVHDHLRAWVDYMDRQRATMEKYRYRTADDPDR